MEPDRRSPTATRARVPMPPFGCGRPPKFSAAPRDIVFVAACHRGAPPIRVPSLRVPSVRVPSSVSLPPCPSLRVPPSVSLPPCPSVRVPSVRVPLRPCPLRPCPSIRVPPSVSPPPCPSLRVPPSVSLRPCPLHPCPSVRVPLSVSLPPCPSLRVPPSVRVSLRPCPFLRVPFLRVPPSVSPLSVSPLSVSLCPCPSVRVPPSVSLPPCAHMTPIRCPRIATPGLELFEVTGRRRGSKILKTALMASSTGTISASRYPSPRIQTPRGSHRISGCDAPPRTIS